MLEFGFRFGLRLFKIDFRVPWGYRVVEGGRR